VVLSVLTCLISANVNSGGGTCDNNPLKAKRNLYYTQFVCHREHCVLQIDRLTGDCRMGKSLFIAAEHINNLYERRKFRGFNLAVGILTTGF
jgi:hypothetical protein